jgi:hypothetical protein
VKLFLKPRPVQLKHLDGTIEELYIDFSQIIFDILDELRSNQQRGVPLNCSLYAHTPTGDVLLESHLSLRECNVKEKDLLVLMARVRRRLCNVF